MEATVSDIGSSVRHRLEGTVLVDRTWARQIGASQAKGARRVGSFYRLPRAEYVRLITPSYPDNELAWTHTDDAAVAELLGEAAQQDSECVGCP